MELEKVKKRRLEREREMEEREKERELEQREKESEYYSAWEKQEDTVSRSEVKVTQYYLAYEVVCQRSCSMCIRCKFVSMTESFILAMQETISPVLFGVQ